MAQEPDFSNQQALLYGEFVQAAYTMSDHPNGDPLRPPPLGIPDGYELGAWIHMSDFVLNATEVKFYGIVVHAVHDPNVRIIAIRGTEGAVEWLDDAAALPVPFRQVPEAGRVAAGFDKIYSTLKVIRRRLPEIAPREKAASQAAAPGPETFEGSFAEQLDQLAASREIERGLTPRTDRQHRPRPTVVVGHSLGAALATLFVMENDAKKKFDITALYTFASPRVGTTEFVQRFNRLPIESWRIVNQHDVVPKIPLGLCAPFDYGHVDKPWNFDSSAWASKNLLCFHTLETYLHALDSAYGLRSECVPHPAGGLAVSIVGDIKSEIEKVLGKRS